MHKINNFNNKNITTNHFLNNKTKKLFLLLSLIGIMMLFYLFDLYKVHIHGTTETYSLLQIPVIIGACIGGPSVGLILCFIYGLVDMTYASFSMNYTDVLLSPFAMSNVEYYTINGNIVSLLMCFVPTIFLALIPSLIFKYFKNSGKSFWQLFLSIICTFLAILLSFGVFMGLFNLVFTNYLSDVHDSERFILIVNSSATQAFIQKLLINLVVDPIAIFAIKNIAHFD